MFRLFNLYFTTRKVVLVGGEAAIISASFLLATLIRFGANSFLVLNSENGFLKILAVTGLALLCSHYLGFHDLKSLRTQAQTIHRLLTVLGTLSFLLLAVCYVFPRFGVGRQVFLAGLLILSLAWAGWRWVYERLMVLPSLRERVYVFGDAVRARRIVEAIRKRKELGMDLVGWANALGPGSEARETMGKILLEMSQRREVDRVIVALADRRNRMPIKELLSLRMNGIKAEDGRHLLEVISGQVEVDEVSPAWLIFSEGFRLGTTYRLIRRSLSIVFSLVLLIIVLPLVPLIALLIRISSHGPVLYHQERVGLNGVTFTCLKFRTMRADAEADSGPTWASDSDPRITRVGRFLRRTRLDEIPQLWNVLRGDMAFVGPRPERPEFVAKLSQDLPYYSLRHVFRPGLTGWAQVNYGYGASVEEAKEKLRYDLYYIKNGSLSLDIIIVLETAKTVLFGHGVR